MGPAIGLVDEGRVYDLTGQDTKRFGSFSELMCSTDLRARMEWGVAQAQNSGADLPLTELDVAPERAKPHLLPPITNQEVWAAGVTYMRSRKARMEESRDGGSFYDRVYHAARPELFFKATPNRVVGPNAAIRIRSDSRWNVPEPELALFVNPRAELVAFTIGDDVSSRDIEGENPLYLPQAKIYAGSCALGPSLLLADSVPDPCALSIHLLVRRGGAVRFEGSTSIMNMKRSFDELISYLFREQEFPKGVLLLTGTGIIPPDDFSLLQGDVVEITVPGIGTLRNSVA